MKTVTIPFREFMNGQNGDKEKKKSLVKPVLITAAVNVILVPTVGFAAGDVDTFLVLYHTGLKIADWLCVGTLMFGGSMWMLGHRAKSLEYILSTCCGYLVVRHALDIRNFLQTL
jgi:hypothetical protein